MNLKYRDLPCCNKNDSMILGKISVSCSKHFKDRRLGDVLKRKQNDWFTTVYIYWKLDTRNDEMHSIISSSAIFFSWPSTDMSLQGSCLNSRVIKSLVYIWKRVFAHWCFALTTCTYIVCYHCNDSSCEYAGQ